LFIGDREELIADFLERSKRGGESDILSFVQKLGIGRGTNP